MKKRKQTKAELTLAKRYLNDECELTQEEFQKLRINLDGSERKLGNIKIKKRGFLSGGGYRISLVDKAKDVNGIQIDEKLDLLRRLISIWENGGTYIDYKETKKMNIYTSLDPIKIGNFVLTQSVKYNKYSIKLRDNKKDCRNRWEDNYTTISKVINAIKKLEDDLKIVKSESALQKLILNHLTQIFHSVKKEVSIGGKSTKIDIEVGNRIGVELKMAKSLSKSAEFQRCIGQVTHDYLKKYSKEYLILIVAGNKKMRTSNEVKDIRKVIHKQDSEFYYLEIL